MALDPNVHIQEVKALTCDIRPGRRPHGGDLGALVTELRGRARNARTRKRRGTPARKRTTG
jgi:hypothetical protein